MKPWESFERATADVIGGKWKLTIIAALEAETLRSGELGRRISGASRKVLTDQLRELQQEQIVSRVAVGKRSERVEYSLTPYGRTLVPVLRHMAKWGETHLRRKEQIHSRQVGTSRVNANLAQYLDCER